MAIDLTYYHTYSRVLVKELDFCCPLPRRGSVCVCVCVCVCVVCACVRVCM